MAFTLKATRKAPNIPQISDDPRSHTLALRAIAEILEIGNRRTKDLFSSFVKVEDLISLGLITVQGNTNAIIGSDLSQIADIGDLSGAAEGDFLRLRSGLWVNDQLDTSDILSSMVTQHEGDLTIDWSQLTGVPPLADIAYQQQVVADKSWLDSEFVRGTNIIGVRYAGAAVRRPHDLSVEKLIHIKDELGGGFTVYSY